MRWSSQSALTATPTLLPRTLQLQNSRSTATIIGIYLPTYSVALITSSSWATYGNSLRISLLEKFPKLHLKTSTLQRLTLTQRLAKLEFSSHLVAGRRPRNPDLSVCFLLQFRMGVTQVGQEC